MATDIQSIGRPAPCDAGGTVTGGRIVGELNVSYTFALLGKLLGRMGGFEAELCGLRRKDSGRETAEAPAERAGA